MLYGLDIKKCTHNLFKSKVVHRHVGTPRRCGYQLRNSMLNGLAYNLLTSIV